MAKSKNKFPIWIILIIVALIFVFQLPSQNTFSTIDNSQAVKFRTGSLNYPGTSSLTNAWISYNNICGSSLVGYGFDMVIKSATSSCNSLGAVLLTNLPHNSTKHLTSDGTGLWNLYNSSIGVLQVCEDESDGIGYGYIQYSTTEYAATTPHTTDTQSISIDSTREKICSIQDSEISFFDKVLFNLFGFDVTGLILVIGLGIIIVLWLVMKR